MSNGIVQFKSNDQLDAENAVRIASDNAAESASSEEGKLNYHLMGVLKNRYSNSVRNKVDVETQFFKNMDQVDRVYDQAKLNAIREISGSEVFIGITQSKTRHAKAWIRDALSQRPWGIKPTPVPDVPKDILLEIQQSFISDTLQKIQVKSESAGIPVDMRAAIQEVQASLPELKNRVKTEVKAEVWERCGEMEKEVDDKLVDGGWYEALDATIPDNIVLGTGIMLGPFKRNKKTLVGSETGVTAADVVTDEFERVSPFQVYPQSSSTGPDNGWVFIKLQYRKLDLQKLIGVEGYDANEIIAVLSEMENGKLRDWTFIETEKATREKKTAESVYDSSIVDCMLYMGPVGGSDLKEAGIDIPDDKLNFDFLANIWYIGDHYIKAVLNEDPLGRQPISISHFEENVDGWWGKGLPELIEPEQTVCNACARAIVNNVAMGSGPQVEINISRLKGGDAGDTRIIPWKRWLTTGMGMQTGNAINFWQPQIHAQEILSVFNEFKKGADERSSIPAYSHGDSQVGGAGNTASGLSMLITQAARGIRGIIKGVDVNMISRSVNFIYERIALDPKYKDKVGDAKLMATGSQALMEKEQRAVRMLEFLNATNNPNDLVIMGPEGRGYLLSEVAKSHDIDPERALPRLQALKGKEIGQTNQTTPPEIPNRGTPPVASRNLAPGGMEPQGGEAQLMAGRGGPPASAPIQ